jgi:hypothetical protein
MVYKPIFNFYPEKRRKEKEIYNGFVRFSAWVKQDHIDAIKEQAKEDGVSIKDLIYAILEKEIRTWKPKN